MASKKPKKLDAKARELKESWEALTRKWGATPSRRVTSRSVRGTLDYNTGPKGRMA